MKGQTFTTAADRNTDHTEEPAMNRVVTSRLPLGGNDRGRGAISLSHAEVAYASINRGNTFVTARHGTNTNR